jgi:hypothetical protein
MNNSKTCYANTCHANTCYANTCHANICYADNASFTTSNKKEEQHAEEQHAEEQHAEEQHAEEQDWKNIQRLALDYDETKTFEENEEINSEVAYAWERVGERKLKEKYELMMKLYESMGIKY